MYAVTVNLTPILNVSTQGPTLFINVSYIKIPTHSYTTDIDSFITYHFNIKNIDRIVNTASDDVCNRVAMLNELIQCGDGILCLFDNSRSMSV